MCHTRYSSIIYYTKVGCSGTTRVVHVTTHSAGKIGWEHELLYCTYSYNTTINTTVLSNWRSIGNVYFCESWHFMGPSPQHSIYGWVAHHILQAKISKLDSHSIRTRLLRTPRSTLMRSTPVLIVNTCLYYTPTDSIFPKGKGTLFKERTTRDDDALSDSPKKLGPLQVGRTGTDTNPLYAWHKSRNDSHQQPSRRACLPSYAAGSLWRCCPLTQGTNWGASWDTH